MSEQEPGKPLPLEYAKSEAPAPQDNGWVGVLGIFTALASLPFWLLGLSGLGEAASLASSMPGRAREFLFVGGVILAIAVVCTFAAVRWMRRGFRRPHP